MRSNNRTHEHTPGASLIPRRGDVLRAACGPMGGTIPAQPTKQHCTDGQHVGWHRVIGAGLLWTAVSASGCASEESRFAQRSEALTNSTNDTSTPINNAVVALVRADGQKDCTGTLVTADWVLTAAHCVVRASQLGEEVRIGLNNDPGQSLATRTVAECFMHPSSYAAVNPALGANCFTLSAANGAQAALASSDFDLALIRLNAPVPRSIARPTPLFISGGFTSVGLAVTLRAFGNSYAQNPGNMYQGAQSAIRQTGTNLLTANLAPFVPFVPNGFAITTGPDLCENGPRTNTRAGDSGSGALVVDPRIPAILPRAGVLGVSSRGFTQGGNPPLSCSSAFTDTSRPLNGAWINTVLSGGNAAMPGVSVTYPTRWLGEGAGEGDNCPNQFNPWQDDDDSDGIGNECDNCPTHANADQRNCNSLTEQQLIAEGVPNARVRGDACDPHPCNAMDVVNPQADAPSLTTCVPAAFPGNALPLYSFMYCPNSAGSSAVSFAFAPRRGTLAANDPGTASVDSPNPALRITAPTYRCLCRKYLGLVLGYAAIPDAECSPGFDTGICQARATPVGYGDGVGWLAAQLDSPAGYAGDRAAVRHNVVGGINAPRFVAPSTPVSFFDAASQFRANESGGARLASWRYNWFPQTAFNPLPPMPLALGASVPPSAQWPRMVFFNRFETVADPEGNLDLTRAQRLQDHYTARPATVINRYDRYIRSVPDWALGAQIWWHFQNLRIVRGPRPDPDPFMARELYAHRYLAAIFPVNAGSSPHASDAFFANGTSADPVRGIVIGRLDVRQSWLQNTAVTSGAVGDLPTNVDASFAVTQLDQEGWGDVWAFGGINATGSASNELFYTTHTVDAYGLPDFVWHRATSTTPAPLARRDATIVANASGTRIYVVGGRNGTTLYEDVPYYDVQAQQWSTLALSSPMGVRYHAAVAVRGDTLYVGEGVGAGGSYLGDLVRVDGLTGSTYSYGNVLPAGASPDMSFDDHGDGLIFGGGYYGSYWYRDLWKVSFNEVVASSSFVYDFGWSGLGPTENFVVVADVEHDMYWGVPGYAPSGNPGGTYFLIDGQSSQVPLGGGGGLLRVAGGGQPGIIRGEPGTRRTRPRDAAVATVTRPAPMRGVVR